MHRRHCLHTLVAAAIWPIFRRAHFRRHCEHGWLQEALLRDAGGTRTTLTYDEQGRVVKVIQHWE